ncbi:MAG: hypothetical protein MUC92_06760 [Fimbriimonadaceae bacterium]|nr:hypothetical protein [Fimbriimonadaceae bacterium]
MIAKMSNEILRRGLETPALMFLEMHKPLAGVAGQAAIVFSPFVAPFVGINAVHDYSRLLGKRENVELLIQSLEKKASEPPKESSS